MMKKLTLGSLFDGSGGFPLGGLICGIEPIWSSEILSFAIRVTTKRLPQVKHYGDIAKLNGAELPPVDIITFGSPCQSVSIAGNPGTIGVAQSETGSWVERCVWYDSAMGLTYSLSVVADDVDGLDLAAVAEQITLPAAG